LNSLAEWLPLCFRFSAKQAEKSMGYQVLDCGSSSVLAPSSRQGSHHLQSARKPGDRFSAPPRFAASADCAHNYGRVSRYGAMALSPSMDKIGPLARSAEDCARVFAAMAGHDPRDRSTLPLDKAAFTYSPSIELNHAH